MPVPLRIDFDAAALRGVAKKAKDAAQARRLLTLAAIYDGATRTEAATIGGVTLQIIRDWVVKFNARGPDGLIDRKAPGQPSKLNDAHRTALMKIIEVGPTPAIHGVLRWRLIDLAQWMFEEFRLSVAVQTLSRELRASCVRWVIVSSQRGRATMRKPRARSRILKKFPGAPGRYRAGKRRRPRQN
jgi:transposase